MLRASIVLALLCVVLPLCSSLSVIHLLLNITHHAPSSASPASSSSLPPSPSVDICVPASAPLFSAPSPLIAIPHAHTLSLYCGQRACACERSRQLFFTPHPIPTSHLTAYYWSWPRRGLTAGNINRAACSDMRSHANTLCSATDPWTTTRCNTHIIHLSLRGFIMQIA